MWLPSEAPTTVILAAPPPGFADALEIDLASWPIVLADRQLGSGRYLVLGDVDGPHRVWLRANTDLGRVAYVIVRDAAIELRHAAVRRFDRRMAGAPPGRLPAGFQPTHFQRQRLAMLLGIADAVLADGRAAVTTHEIARHHVYSGMTIGRGGEWKSSSERRRTQRLIDEALALVHGGYRSLLRG